MHEKPQYTRRGFLASTGRWSVIAGALTWPSALKLAEAATTASHLGASFNSLSNNDAATLNAIAARIIPSDETPGALEFNVIYFIDQALGSFMATSKDGFLSGLAMLAEAARQPLLEMNDEAMDNFLKEHENTQFFETMRYLTIVGSFAMSSYGGNRDNLGWEMLGFQQEHGWHPPFGHYDAAEMKKARPDD